MIAFVLKIIICVQYMSAGQKIKNEKDSNLFKVSTNTYSYDEIDEYFGDLNESDIEIDPKTDIEEALLEFIESELKMEESDDEKYRPGDKKMHIFDEKRKEKTDEATKLDINNDAAKYIDEDGFTAEKLHQDNIDEEKKEFFNKSQEKSQSNFSKTQIEIPLEDEDEITVVSEDYEFDLNNNFN